MLNNKSFEKKNKKKMTGSEKMEYEEKFVQ